MPDIKLSKLPDRTPVKISITVSPDLYHGLRRYADLYQAQFGQAEPIAELIPYMLADFLNGDRAFAKARKVGMTDNLTSLSSEARPRRRSGSNTSRAPSTANGEA